MLCDVLLMVVSKKSNMVVPFVSNGFEGLVSLKTIGVCQQVHSCEQVRVLKNSYAFGYYLNN